MVLIIGGAMACYLRDERISNITIDADCLSQLGGVFLERTMAINNAVGNNADGEKAIFTCIIRFDNKGYRVFSVEELLNYFQLGKDVERILLTIETGESLSSNRQIGTYLELRLDNRDQANCFLTVTSDDKDLVDASFSAIHDALSKYKNKNTWVRSVWTQLFIQIIGVSLGFILSLWGANLISRQIEMENPFVLSFLFLILIFSNLWGYINQAILWGLNSLFPNLKFYRQDKETLHWLMQTIVGGIVVAIVFFFLNEAFSFLMIIMNSIIHKGG